MNTMYNAEIEFQADNEDGYDYLYVDLDLEWDWECNDYDDEFGTCEMGSGFVLSEVTWDKAAYTQTQNKLIQGWVDDNYSWMNENCATEAYRKERSYI